MIHESIIDEVRAIRDQFAKEHDYDIAAIFMALRELDASGGRHHVTLPPRRVNEPTASKEAGTASPT